VPLLCDSEGIFPGLVIIISLELTAPVIGYNVTICRLLFSDRILQYGTKGDRPGSVGLLLSGLSVFPS